MQTGRRRALDIGRRLGVSLRHARLATGMTQAQLAAATLVSQPEISRLERGHGGSASIETWSVVGAACGTSLAAFFEALPGADRPRDYEHLKRQQLVITTSEPGGWHPSVERRTHSRTAWSGSVDVRLDRMARRETAIIEIWDWFDDLGSAVRGLAAKVIAAEREHAARELEGDQPWRVAGLIVVRRTNRNRELVREFATLFRAQYPASAAAWLAALHSDRSAMPDEPGFLWTDVRGARLFAPRF